MSLSSAVDGGDEDDGDSVGWRLFRNMSEETRQLCDAWGDLKGSSCVTMDSGVYWCVNGDWSQQHGDQPHCDR